VTLRRSALAVLASGVMLSGCGFGSASPKSASSSQTPTQDAIAWFNAIDANNVRAARSLFEPSQRGQIRWMNQPATDQSKFTDVRCRRTALRTNTASVLCTFKESSSPTEGQPDTWWSVEFRRSSNSGWLIDNYGQG
jgi:hypothetical protein